MTDYTAVFERYENLTPVDPDASPVAILVAGVPGVGKSTLAEGLARRLRAPVFGLDWQLGALTPFAELADEVLEALADVTLVAPLARQLQLGLDVVVDVTGHQAAERRRYRRVAEGLGARLVGVECVCSDAMAHRARVVGRDRGIPGWRPTVPWEHVLRMKGLWEPWTEPHVVLDSAKQDAETMVARVLDEVAAGRGAGAGLAVSPRR
ncbi:AAA family ATPase [Catenulispora yoronensis]|uniref:AAA family ATPase n=1 Tax=Catenulispora yoronensis TaxID=450799 RepID=A0ABP5H757_9ACTN